MKYIKLKLDYALYGYDNRLFLPIREDMQMINKAAFVRYKLVRLIHNQSWV